jgi:hypothetical protein
MGERGMHTGFWLESLGEGDHLKDQGVDGRIILKWIFKKWKGAWTGLVWFRRGTDGGLFKCNNEISISIKCETFLE